MRTMGRQHILPIKRPDSVTTERKLEKGQTDRQEEWDEMGHRQIRNVPDHGYVCIMGGHARRRGVHVEAAWCHRRVLIKNFTR